MKTTLFITAFLLDLCSCTKNQIYEARPWSDVGYTGFAEQINVLASKEGIDCGFYDLIEDKSAESKLQKFANPCVRRMIKEGKPFKFGTLRIPSDSYAYEILALSPSGEYWVITLDIMLDQSEAQLFIEKCEKANINKQSSSFIGIDCTSFTKGSWDEHLNKLSKALQ